MRRYQDSMTAPKDLPDVLVIIVAPFVVKMSGHGDPCTQQVQESRAS